MSIGAKDPTSWSRMSTPWTLRVTELRRLIALNSQSLSRHIGTASRRAEGSTPREGA